MRKIRNESGSVGVVLIFLVLFVWAGIASILTVLASQYRAASRVKASAAALYVAEGGARRGLWELSRGHAGYAGESDLDVGVASVETKSEDGRIFVVATGYVPDKKHPRATETIRIEAVKDKSGVYRTAAWQRL